MPEAIATAYVDVRADTSKLKRDIAGVGSAAAPAARAASRAWGKELASISAAAARAASAVSKVMLAASAPVTLALGRSLQVALKGTSVEAMAFRREWDAANNALGNAVERVGLMVGRASIFGKSINEWKRSLADFLNRLNSADIQRLVTVAASLTAAAVALKMASIAMGAVSGVANLSGVLARGAAGAGGRAAGAAAGSALGASGGAAAGAAGAGALASAMARMAALMPKLAGLFTSTTAAIAVFVVALSGMVALTLGVAQRIRGILEGVIEAVDKMTPKWLKGYLAWKHGIEENFKPTDMWRIPFNVGKHGPGEGYHRSIGGVEQDPGDRPGMMSAADAIRSATGAGFSDRILDIRKEELAQVDAAIEKALRDSILGTPSKTRRQFDTLIGRRTDLAASLIEMRTPRPGSTQEMMQRNKLHLERYAMDRALKGPEKNALEDAARMTGVGPSGASAMADAIMKLDRAMAAAEESALSLSGAEAERQKKADSDSDDFSRRFAAAAGQAGEIAREASLEAERMREDFKASLDWNLGMGGQVVSSAQVWSTAQSYEHAWQDKLLSTQREQLRVETSIDRNLQDAKARTDRLWDQILAPIAGT